MDYDDDDDDDDDDDNDDDDDDTSVEYHNKSYNATVLYHMSDTING